MTKIDFIKFGNSESEILTYLFFAIKNNYFKGSHILCLTPSENFSSNLSNALWTYEPQTFIPHCISKSDEVVSITHLPEPNHHSQILFNYQQEMPDWFSRFDQVIEIIPSDKDSIKTKQNIYSCLKKLGYSLSFEDLSK